MISSKFAGASCGVPHGYGIGLKKIKIKLRYCYPKVVGTRLMKSPSTLASWFQVFKEGQQARDVEPICMSQHV
jgi:hypothetical protein